MLRTYGRRLRLSKLREDLDAPAQKAPGRRPHEEDAIFRQPNAPPPKARAASRRRARSQSRHRSPAPQPEPAFIPAKGLHLQLSCLSIV